MERPEVDSIYRHFKGNKYQVLCIAENSENGQEEVIYKALYSPYKIYARELSNFMSPVDRDKYPSVKQKNRFEKVVEAEENSNDKSYLKTDTDEQILMRFLGVSGYDNQLECLTDIRERLTEKMMTTIEFSLGMEEQEGSIDDRYRAVKRYIMVKQKYERIKK